MAIGLPILMAQMFFFRTRHMYQGKQNSTTAGFDVFWGCHGAGGRVAFKSFSVSTETLQLEQQSRAAQSHSNRVDGWALKEHYKLAQIISKGIQGIQEPRKVSIAKKNPQEKASVSFSLYGHNPASYLGIEKLKRSPK